MKNLLFISCLVLFSCRSAYQGLEPTRESFDCLNQLRPNYQSTWYSTKVDVIGKHLSGLLLIKQFSNGSIRVVLTNEPGVKFFDLEFTDSFFKVHYIMEQLNKKPVIKMLQKDFGLILKKPSGDEKIFLTKDKEKYWGFRAGKEITFWVTDEKCSTLKRIESIYKGKKKIEIEFFGDHATDSLHLQHFNFNMQIALKALPAEN